MQVHHLENHVCRSENRVGVLSAAAAARKRFAGLQTGTISGETSLIRQSRMTITSNQPDDLARH
jgi:hypothetical protein